MPVVISFHAAADFVTAIDAHRLGPVLVTLNA
jgi:hypothetical protein